MNRLAVTRSDRPYVGPSGVNDGMDVTFGIGGPAVVAHRIVFQIEFHDVAALTRAGLSERDSRKRSGLSDV